MQRQVFSNIQVPREDYPYLLAYLQQRFGSVQRVNNSFVNASGQRVAMLLNPEAMMLLGQGIFQAERVSITSVVGALKSKGKLRFVRANLLFCERCQAFYTSRFPSSEHTAEGEQHPLTQLLTLSFPSFVSERKPLFASRAWVSPDLLARVFAARRSPRVAATMARFRCDAYGAGVKLTIQELLDHTADTGPVIEEAELVGIFLNGEAYERYVARPRPDPRTGASRAAGRRRAYFVSQVLVEAPDRESPRRTLPTYGWKGGSMLEWKVKVNGKVLSREQKLAAMVQLGLLGENTFQQAVGEAPQDARPEDVPTMPLDEEERIRQRYMRVTKRGWKPKKISAKKERTPRDSKAPVSVRYAEVAPNPQQLEIPATPPEERPQPPTTQPPTTQPPRNPYHRHPEPAPKTPEQIKEERSRFLQLFNISPEEIVYEKDTMIKAAKVVDSENDARRVQIFNSVFYPQRTPLRAEFDPRDVALAERVASEMRGNVVVIEDRKNGFSSLAVSVAGSYTVRVATRRETTNEGDGAAGDGPRAPPGPGRNGR